MDATPQDIQRRELGETSDPAGGSTIKEQLVEKTHAVTDGAKTTLSEAVGNVRAKAGNLQAQLADVLDAGAASLRRQTSALASAPKASGDADTPAGTPQAVVASVAAKVAPLAAERGEMAAGLMEHGAMWLRENDLSDLEAQLSSQLETRPLRTLAIAAAVGFLVSRRGD